MPKIPQHQIQVIAKLEIGEVVVLEKDCGCMTHDGPHWVHIDKCWQESNRRRLLHSSPLGFAKEEKARLVEKLRNFSIRGIVKLEERRVLINA